MKRLVLNKNRGWRGLAEAQLLDEDNNTIQKMIFSFSQPVWNDMLRGVMVMQNEQDYIILEFDYEHSRLPRPSQQRSVLIKNVILPIVNIKTYSKKTWMKDHTSAGDYSAIYNFLKNRNNHTTSDWNCIRNQSHSNYIVNRLEREVINYGI